ncbi:hypothetical protein [uncultured Oscillibacter sp.]|uniref:hypothetical protein n=1 Tax=uncultured Oscillibacter sp. TaxID=876091 RepID=UPI00262047B3|nr:hypothetical protein [uncultured Oscillibacter sp.]
MEKVIFKRLTHKGENKKSQLIASLELWEYIPQTITATKSSGGVQGSGNPRSSSTSGAKAPSASNRLGDEYQEYLSSDRGTVSAADLKKRKRMESKRNKSPAVDNAKADTVLGKQFRAGAIVSVALLYGELVPVLIGEVEL